MMGCPGCFEFSKTRYREVETSTLAQRLRTPKTRQQEAQDRQARHKSLFLHKQLIVPPLLFRRHQRSSLSGRSEENSSGGRGSTPHLSSVDTRRSGDTEVEYYMGVLPDVHAIRKHRAMYAPLLRRCQTLIPNVCLELYAARSSL